MIVPYSHVLILSGILFLIGFIGVVVRRNLIMVLLGMEVMLNAGSIAFIGGALRWQHLEGQMFVLFILAVAAAEVSVGLALVLCIYRWKRSIDPAALGTF
jgi:NADH-quinone oxidoreductase subunit K